MTVRIINRGIFLTALLLCIPAGAATAQETIRGTQMTEDDLPNQLSNNTPADANKVMQNLGSILQSLQGVTKLHLYQNGEHKGSSILANVMLLDTGYAALVWSENGSDNVYLGGDNREVYYESQDCSGPAYTDSRIIKYKAHLGEKGYLLAFKNVKKAFVQSVSSSSTDFLMKSYQSESGYEEPVCEVYNEAEGYCESFSCASYTCYGGDPYQEFYVADPSYCEPSQEYYCDTPNYEYIPAGTCQSTASWGFPEGFYWSGYPVTANNAGVTGVSVGECGASSDLCLPNANLVSE